VKTKFGRDGCKGKRILWNSLSMHDEIVLGG
jgi:hypothetical protein